MTGFAGPDGMAGSMPPTPEMRTAGRRRYFVALRLLIVAVTVAGLLWATRQALAQLRDQPPDWSRIDWSGILRAAGWCCAATAAAALFWRQFLSAAGYALRPGLALRAFASSQLGKYVPGKAMVIVIRTGILRGQGVPLGIGIASVFVETLLWIAVGSAVGLAALAATGLGGRPLAMISALAAAAAGLATTPPFFRTAFQFASRTAGAAGQSLTSYSWQIWGTGVALAVLGWSAAGLGLSELLEATGPSPAGWASVPLCLASAALATVAGFLSLVPGGLGVRELVILPLLATTFPAAQAITATVLFRLVSIAAELLLTVAGAAWSAAESRGMAEH